MKKNTYIWTNQGVCSTVAMGRDRQALTVVNGIDLQPIQLKQPSLDGDVTNEVKSLHGSHGTDSILLLRQVPWLRPARAGEARGERGTCFLQQQ